MRIRLIVGVTFLISVMGFAAGCYEDVGGSSQAQQPAPPAGQNSGPITNMAVGQPNGSALGAAKRSATNVVERAEQQSREVGEQADDPAKDQ